MIRLTYAGPIDAVTVYLPSGRTIEVRRGETVDLLAPEAAALTDHPDWAPEVREPEEPAPWES